ncbi:MAG: N5-glutamine methyltransferase family protein, partial [Terriglobia bacterium]
MRLRDALRQAAGILLDASIPSPELAAEVLLMHVLNCDRGFLHSHPETAIAQQAAERYFRLIGERLTGKPTQYITGHQEFWGLDFEVTPDVLIPRPETECLVEAALDLIRRPGGSRPGEADAGAIEGAGAARAIVDVGTGSGCIALALASQMPEAMVNAVDISPAALRVAERNAARLACGGRVRFRESDLLSVFLAEAPRRAFDMVISNPPYVGRDEKDKV